MSKASQFLNTHTACQLPWLKGLKGVIETGMGGQGGEKGKQWGKKKREKERQLVDLNKNQNIPSINQQSQDRVEFKVVLLQGQSFLASIMYPKF